MTEKICPFQSDSSQDVNCYGKGCQLWVSVGRNRIVEAGETKFADPEYEYRFEGCGLLQVVPWELVKKEKKP